MEKVKVQRKRILTISEIGTISVLVIDEKLHKTELKTIEIHDVVEKFPSTNAGRIFKQFGYRIPFDRCLKAFLEIHFEGTVEPMFEPGKIDGLTPKEIGLIEKLCKKKMNLKRS